MKPRGRKPTPLHGRGEIRGDAIYPISVLMKRLGIARNSLTSLHGAVGWSVHSIGRRCSLVYGWELLALLRSESDCNSQETQPAACVETSGRLQKPTL